jgi:hypothetical protein
LCWWHGAREDRIERDFGFLLVAVLACFDQFLSLQSRCIDEEDVLPSGCRIEEVERHIAFESSFLWSGTKFR